MISKTPEDLQYYEDRLKSLRDEQALLQSAREEGREEGRSSVISTVRVLEELAGDPVTPVEALMTLSLEELISNVAKLQQKLRERYA